jgi:hypothetical protein
VVGSELAHLADARITPTPPLVGAGLTAALPAPPLEVEERKIGLSIRERAAPAKTERKSESVPLHRRGGASANRKHVSPRAGVGGDLVDAQRVDVVAVNLAEGARLSATIGPCLVSRRGGPGSRSVLA